MIVSKSLTCNRENGSGIKVTEEDGGGGEKEKKSSWARDYADAFFLEASWQTTKVILSYSRPARSPGSLGGVPISL